MNYTDPILKKIRDLIKNNNNKIKTYYYGDPDSIPTQSLPACILSVDSIDIDTETSYEDRQHINLSITVEVDLRSDWNKNPESTAGYSTLYELVNGRSSDYSFNSDALLNILRHNQQVDSDLTIDLDSPLTVEFPKSLKQRGNDLFTIQAVIKTRITLVKNF